MGYFTDDFLRKLRNEINIDEVIGALCLETRRGTDLVRFHCPLCHWFSYGDKFQDQSGTMFRL